MNTKIGFIGLGLMGLPMANNLVKAGLSVTVWNRTASSMDAVVSAGAKASTSAKEVATNSDLIITMVSDSADVEDVVLGKYGVIEGATPNSVVIDMSTISPSVTRMIAKKLIGKGIQMLDAPVSGGDTGAKTGTLSIMVGGDTKVFDRCLPILQVLGNQITHCGENGMGQLTKLANQIIGMGNLAALCEALVFSVKAGGDPKTLLNAWKGGAANSWMVQNMPPRIFDRDFSPGFMVKLAQKDLRLVLETAADLNVPLFTTPLVSQIFRSAQQDGHGEEGIQAYVKVLEKLAGITAET